MHIVQPESGGLSLDVQVGIDPPIPSGSYAYDVSSSTFVIAAIFMYTVF